MAQERGWRVFPCTNTNGKPRPTLTGWQDRASSDPDTIRDLWAKYSGDIVAIRCGPGGPLVLDIDISGDKTGAESFEQLTEILGPLPETLTATSGSGGTHYYFQWEDVGHTALDGKLAPHVDVKIGTEDKGAYIYAPPSQRTDHPGSYHWHDAVAPVAKLPIAWLEAMIRGQRVVKDKDAESRPLPSGVIKKLAAGPIQNRDSNSFALARYFAEHHSRAFGLLPEPETVSAWLIAEYASRFDPPLGHDTGDGDPFTEDDLLAKCERAIEYVSAKVGDDEGGTPAHVMLAELMADPDLLEIPELVGRWVGLRGELTLFYGREKAGKSTLLTQEAVEIAAQGHPVLWVTGEETERRLVTRFVEKTKALGIEDPRQLPIRLLPMSLTRSWEALERALAHGPVFTVIDSLYAVLSKIEPDLPESLGDTRWRELTHRIKQLAYDYDTAMVLNSHTSKSGEHYGSALIRAMTDAEALFEAVPRKLRQRRLSRSTGRYSFPDIDLLYTPDGLYRELSTDTPDEQSEAQLHEVVGFVMDYKATEGRLPARSAIREGVRGVRNTVVDSLIDHAVEIGRLTLIEDGNARRYDVPDDPYDVEDRLINDPNLGF